jgi:GxxExxY protein
MTKKSIDSLSYEIIGAAIEVHRSLGPGLLESLYHKCLRHELALRNFSIESELDVPIVYKDLNLRTDLRCDLLVNNSIVVELKAVEILMPVFTAQLLSYMRLLKAPKGILINFNCSNIFKEGQKTLVNEFYRNLPD